MPARGPSCHTIIAEPLESRTLQAANTADILNAPTARQTSERPEAVIVTPTASTLYRGGARVLFAGQATASSGLPLDERFWRWRLIQLQPGPARILDTVAGQSNGSFLIPRSISPDPARPLAVQLIVRQPGGLFGREQVTLTPQLAALAITATADDASVGVNGQAITPPQTMQFVAGTAPRITASRLALQNGAVWEFVRWSDGGARSHRVSLPVGGRTLTAIYTFTVTPPVFGTQLIQPA